jgi:hypothetical protein
MRRIAQDRLMTVGFDWELKIFRCLWAWENGYPIDPEPIAAPILLRRNEACYFTTAATWSQVKTFKERAGFSGFSTSVRVMRGMSYRVSTFRPQYQTWKGMVDIAEGNLYVTNKKIWFDSKSLSTSIPYSRVVGFELYIDGVQLKKTAGRSDYFRTNKASAEYIIALIQHFVA